MANDVPLQPGQDPTPKGGLFSSFIADTSQVAVDVNTRALLSGFFWATSFNGPRAATTVPYSFPTSDTDYTSVPGGYADPDSLAGFAPLTADQENAVRTSFDLISSYTNLTFNEVSSGLAVDAAIRVAGNSQGSSSANFPLDGRVAGDTWLGNGSDENPGNGAVPAEFFGTD